MHVMKGNKVQDTVMHTGTGPRCVLSYGDSVDSPSQRPLGDPLWHRCFAPEPTVFIALVSRRMPGTLFVTLPDIGSQKCSLPLVGQLLG